MSVDSYGLSVNADTDHDSDGIVDIIETDVSLFAVVDAPDCSQERGSVRELFAKVAETINSSDDIEASLFDNGISELLSSDEAGYGRGVAALCLKKDTAYCFCNANTRLYHIHKNEIKPPDPDRPGVYSVKAVPADGFLMCSKILAEYLMENEILIDYLKADNAKTWLTLLLLRAMERLPQEQVNLSVIAVLV